MAPHPAVENGLRVHYFRRSFKRFPASYGGTDVTLGISGSPHDLLAELGIEVWIGDAAEIKTKRVRKQKTDREDARLLLRLLRENNFPRSCYPVRRIVTCGNCCGTGIDWSRCGHGS